MKIMTVEKLAERAKGEILDDIAAGIVPATVGTFSQLHDYVDANGYGGLFELEVDDVVGWANAVQDDVDRWLRFRAAEMGA